MADYLAETYAAGGNTGVGVQGIGYNRVERVVVNVPDFIARNATLTTNKKITSGDVFQIINVPAHTLVKWTAVKVITACTAGTTVDIGIAGGDEFQDGVNVVTVSSASTLLADDYGAGAVQHKHFTAADTIDLTFKADETIGEFIVFAEMIHLK